jgi:hypothetical protein
MLREIVRPAKDGCWGFWDRWKGGLKKSRGIHATVRRAWACRFAERGVLPEILQLPEALS